MNNDVYFNYHYYSNLRWRWTYQEYNKYKYIHQSKLISNKIIYSQKSSDINDNITFSIKNSQLIQHIEKILQLLPMIGTYIIKMDDYSSYQIDSFTITVKKIEQLSKHMQKIDDRYKLAYQRIEIIS